MQVSYLQEKKEKKMKKNENKKTRRFEVVTILSPLIRAARAWQLACMRIGCDDETEQYLARSTVRGSFSLQKMPPVLHQTMT
jgi:hypothetical protein